MENYILQFLKNGIEELRIERYNREKNPLAKSLTAFIDAELKKNELKKELVHYQLYVGDHVFDLWEGQSPRGIRVKDKRPELLKINTNKAFTRLDLEKHIKYLGELLMAFDYEEYCPVTCESCEKEFDIEMMETDSGGNYFCSECWAVLAPQMKTDYDEMVKNGEIEENE